MKNTRLYIAVLTLAIVAGFSSCKKDELSQTSVITADEVLENQFDLWLNENFVAPYNLQYKYRMEDIESDMDYYLVPAYMESSIKMAHLLKHLCLDLYDEVAGPDFTRGYFPKLIQVIGSAAYRNNGTMVLGTAEGGKKITLYYVNELDDMIEEGPEYLNHYYFKTIHHEFTHILNQTKPYPASFQLISGTDYVADYWSESPYSKAAYYTGHGFMSSYSQYSDSEDFAELFSIYVTNPAEYWESMLASAEKNGATYGIDAAEILSSKMDVVKNYMLDSWGIDMDTLRDALQTRQDQVVNGYVDLEDISTE